MRILPSVAWRSGDCTGVRCVAGLPTWGFWQAGVFVSLTAADMPRLPRSVEQRLRVADQKTGRCVRAANRYADTKELWRAREREIEQETRQADSGDASDSTGGDAVDAADTRIADSRPTQHSAKEAEEWHPSTFCASKRKRGEAWRVTCGWCELRRRGARATGETG